MKTIKHYGVITLSIFIMAVGVYFFKFPNNFCFGGVTGMAAVVARITPLSASTFTTLANLLLLAVAWLFVDRKFAMDTAYALLEHHLVSAVASDAHSPLQRTPYMQDAWEALSGKFPERYLKILFEENPRRICESLPTQRFPLKSFLSEDYR